MGPALIDHPPAPNFRQKSFTFWLVLIDCKVVWRAAFSLVYFSVNTSVEFIIFVECLWSDADFFELGIGAVNCPENWYKALPGCLKSIPQGATGAYTRSKAHTSLWMEGVKYWGVVHGCCNFAWFDPFRGGHAKVTAGGFACSIRKRILPNLGWSIRAGPIGCKKHWNFIDFWILERNRDLLAAESQRSAYNALNFVDLLSLGAVHMLRTRHCSWFDEKSIDFMVLVGCTISMVTMSPALTNRTLAPLFRQN